MLGSKNLILTTGLVYLSGVANSFDGFCYGYGTILGEPSLYLEDDMDDVTRDEVGQST